MPSISTALWRVSLAIVAMSLAATPASAETASASQGGSGPEGQGEQASLEAHVQALDSPDAATRLDAARALGELRTPAAVPVLTRVLSSDPVPEVRGWCVQSLHQIGTPEAHSAVADAARSDRDQRVRDLAASLCPDCAPTQRPSAEAPSPFPPQPSAPAPAQTAAPQPAQVAAPVDGAQQPAASAPAAAPPVQDPMLRRRATRLLAAGIVLLVASALPFSIGGVSVGYWERVEVDGPTTTWTQTSAYPASIFLFTVGGLLSLTAIALIPVGAVQLSRSRSAQLRHRWIGSLTPFASPTPTGGAVVGLTGYFF